MPIQSPSAHFSLDFYFDTGECVVSVIVTGSCILSVFRQITNGGGQCTSCKLVMPVHCLRRLALTNWSSHPLNSDFDRAAVCRKRARAVQRGRTGEAVDVPGAAGFAQHLCARELHHLLARTLCAAAVGAARASPATCARRAHVRRAEPLHGFGLLGAGVRQRHGGSHEWPRNQDA